MTDVVNLNSIRSTGCDCYKPKPQPCGCGNHPQQPYPTLNLDDLYFKVKNLFSELKSEWQRTEARSNLGITDIIDLKLIKFGEGSGDTNIWEMTTSKGGSRKVYDFVVKNGEAGAPGKDGKDGKTPNITFAKPYALLFGEDPEVRNLGTSTDLVLLFGIPSGKNGLSAYEVYRENTVNPLDVTDWLESLKGAPGEPGPAGKDGEDGEYDDSRLIKDIFPAEVRRDQHMNLPGNMEYTGDIIIWWVQFEDNSYKTFWTPFNVSSGNSPESPDNPEISNLKGMVFLFHKVDFGHIPTENELISQLLALQGLINTTSNGKQVTELSGWYDIAPIIVNQGQEFIYLAIAETTNNLISSKWSVIQLTGTKGEKGEKGDDGVCPECEEPTPVDPNSHTEDPTLPETPKYGVDYDIDLEISVIPIQISERRFDIECGLNLAILNKTDNYLEVKIPASLLSRQYSATNNLNDSYSTSGLFTIRFSDIKVICPPKENGNNTISKFYADSIYLVAGNISTMVSGGDVTTLSIYSLMEPLNPDALEINDFTFTDNTDITYDNFELVTVDNFPLTYNYIMPGETIVKYVEREKILSAISAVATQTLFGMQKDRESSGFNVSWVDWESNVTRELPYDSPTNDTLNPGTSNQE